MKRSTLLLGLLALCAASLLTISLINPHAASFEGASDRRFANGSSADAIPLIFSDKGHMFLRVRVNNSAPLLFGLDSGFEQTAVTSKQAKTLNLKTYGDTKATGVGEGEDDISFARNVRFDLPGVNFGLAEIGVLALNFQSPIPDEPIAGILGYDFFRQFVVSINYADSSINVYSPRSFRYRGRGEILPIRMIDNYPSIPATVTLPGLRPLRTLLGIDSGAASGIFF